MHEQIKQVCGGFRSAFQSMFDIKGVNEKGGLHSATIRCGV